MTHQSTISALDPQAFQRARPIFESAVDAPASDRGRLIEQACGDDQQLLAAVQAMVRADAEPHTLLDTKPIAPAARWPPNTLVAGHLRIDTLAGRGGMGEVYRAHDETLGRDVAVKVLQAAAIETSGLPNRLARFEREAQILAALNHPNIAAIYGVVDVDSTKALVLEFVDGPTLADRIASGPLAIDEVVSVARQIATALEAAHENGIIHRDLKPSNIKVRPDGTVKLLDFGLAKVVQIESAAPDSSGSNPAITSNSVVQRGAFFGTPAYMSPEQAKGREIDRRSDIWAFGAVLYEMLAGKRAFTGDDVPETMASVLRADVNLAELPASTPTAVRTLVGRCLERNASRRLRDIGEARIVLEDLNGAAAPAAAPTADSIRRGPWWLAPLAAAAVTAVVVAAAAGWTYRAPTPAAAPKVKRFSIDLPDQQVFPVSIGKLLSVSADGETVAYIAANPQERSGRLYRRRVDELDSTPIAEADAHEPALSADGKWIAYSVNTTLKKAPTIGSDVQILAQLPAFARGLSWAGDGSLIVGSVSTSIGLLRVPAAGGVPEQLTTPADGFMHWDPQALPDGRRILYTSIRPYAEGPGTVMVLDLETGKSRQLVSGALVRLVPGGTLLYLRDSAIWAVPFDSSRLEATGAAARLVNSVRVEVGGAMQVSAADDGTIVYLAGGSTTTRVVTFDRSNRSASLPMPRRVYSEPRVSPDGRRLAMSMQDQDNDIWIWSFDRRTLTRLTLDSAIETSPAWTPDGSRIIFASQRDNRPPNPYWQAADGTGHAEQLIETAYPTDQFSMAPDGRRLLMRVRLEQTSAGIAVVDLSEQPRRLRILIDTRFNERSPAVSPDGRWVAYESDESGRREVYVKPFPNVDGGRWQVSTSGGISPRWSLGGRQLTFVSGDGTWHTVPVIEAPVHDGLDFRFGAASRASPTDTALTLSYDIFADGKRFVAVQGDVAPANKRLTVVLNGLTGNAR